MPIRPLSAVLAGAALSGVVLLLALPRASRAETVKLVPPPAVEASHVPARSETTAPSETTILAGGCFWGVQGVFQHVDGVTSAVSGYTGGTAEDASYPTVSGGATGHAESVKVTFDPRKVSFGKLLQIYFSVVADPTTLNAQGPDSGSQYRSAIFATTPEQASIAKSYIGQLEEAHVFAAPIVTQVDTGKTFYPAETYHQNYLTEHPRSSYIMFNDLPKVEGLHKLFASDYREAPVLATAATN